MTEEIQESFNKTRIAGSIAAQTLDEISIELNINRGTIYNNLNDINDYYYIIKYKKEYYIKKI